MVGRPDPLAGEISVMIRSIGDDICPPFMICKVMLGTFPTPGTAIEENKEG
jgi:hypothetical protein